MCNGNPKCENYGLSLSCPPHVSGPMAFKKWINQSTVSILVKIDLPSEIMFSTERRQVMQLLHQTVAGVEHKAVELGFRNSRAFAGGSCKTLFCRDKAECRVISTRGKCRHPAWARPSMSGFGVNVGKLMQSAGWPAKILSQKEASDTKPLSWVAGLILIAD